MIRSNNRIRNRVFFAFGLAAVLGIFFYMNCRTGLYMDDYSYSLCWFGEGARVSSLSDIYRSMYGHYFGTNGRVLLHSVGMFMLMHSKIYFNIFNTLCFGTLGFAVYFLSFGTFRNFRSWFFFLEYLALYFLTPAFGQSFLWLIGSCNYHLGILIVCVYLVPWRAALTRADKKLPLPLDIPAALLAFVFGVAAGWTNENLCVALVVIEIGFLILLGVKRIRIWTIAGFIGSVAGTLFLLLAPATAVRAANRGGFGSLLEMFGRVPGVTLNLFQNLWPMMVFCLLMLIYSLSHSKKGQRKGFGIALVFLLGAGISVYAMCAAPMFPTRVWSGIIVCCLVTTGAVCSTIPDDTEIRQFFSGVLFTLILLFCMHFPGTSKALEESYQSYLDRRSFITYQVSIGNKDLTVPSIYYPNKYTCYIHGWELQKDPNVWPNTVIAKYYGLDSIAKGPDYKVNE